MNEQREDENRIPVGVIRFGGTTWQVSLHRTAHNFWAASPGFTEISGRTYDEVHDGVHIIVGKSKAKVSVPYVFVKWEQNVPSLVPGIATGIHNGNGKVLATQGGRSRSLEITAWGRSEYMTPFTEGEAERYLDLLARQRSLDEMIKVYEDDHKWNGRNLRAKVEKEVEEARVARMAEAEGDDGEPGHGYWEAGDL